MSLVSGQNQPRGRGSYAVCPSIGQILLLLPDRGPRGFLVAAHETTKRASRSSTLPMHVAANQGASAETSAFVWTDLRATRPGIDAVEELRAWTVSSAKKEGAAYPGAWLQGTHTIRQVREDRCLGGNVMRMDPPA